MKKLIAIFVLMGCFMAAFADKTRFYELVPHAGPDARGRCRPRAPKPGVCAVWVHSGRGIPGPPTQGSPSCKSSKQAPPPRGREGVSGGPPAQQPRLKPGVWEAPCPVCLCHLCLENPCGPFECSKKAREFNVLHGAPREAH